MNVGDVLWFQPGFTGGHSLVIVIRIYDAGGYDMVAEVRRCDDLFDASSHLGQDYLTENSFLWI